MRRHWTAEEVQFLRWLYPHVSSAKIATLLGRTASMIYQGANRLGLRKSPEFLLSAESGILRPGESRPESVKTQFRKGQVPANKGLRRPGWAPGRMRETQFRRGMRSGCAARNWCPVGTVRADGEGFLRIKVREAESGKREATGFGNTKIWPMLNRHLWEQAKGPIPPGHAVVFKDGDRARCELENLELISRRDLMLRNSIHYRYPKELVNVIMLNGALKRKLRRRAREEQNDGPAEPSV